MSSSEEVAMDVEVDVDVDVEEEVIDELKVIFEELEENVSEMTPDTAPNLCAKFQEVLSNDRSDEVATKIKEKCIYRYLRLTC